MRRFNNLSGFTLLEVLVACGILTIGLASIMTVYSSSLNGLSLAGKYELAHFTAESILSRTIFEAGKVPFNKTGKTDQPPRAVWTVRGQAGDLPGLDTIHVAVTFKHAGKTRTVEIETSQMVQP